MNLTGQVAERYVRDAMALDPVSATLAGISGFDDQMADLTRDGFEARAELDRRTIAAIREVAPASEPEQVARTAMLERLGLADPRTAAAIPAWPAINTLSTTGPRLPTLADAYRYAANLAWMSYLNRPCGIAGVTLVEASRELPCNGEKHVSASATVPGMARIGPPRSTDSSRSAQPGLEPAMQRRHRVR
jgi:hypothetical protein